MKFASANITHPAVLELHVVVVLYSPVPLITVFEHEVQVNVLVMEVLPPVRAGLETNATVPAAWVRPFAVQSVQIFPAAVALFKQVSDAV